MRLPTGTQVEMGILAFCMLVALTTAVQMAL